MFKLAFNNLFQQKGKLLISISGVAFSVVMIVLLIGLYQGFNTKLGEYVRTVPADVWVAQQGSKNLLDGTSILPTSLGETIESLDGVSSVKHFNGRQIAVEVDGDEKNAFLIGLGSGSGAVAPKIIEGSAQPKAGEIILDNSIRDITVGQQVTVAGKTFTVSGIATGSNVLVASFAFVSEKDASDLFRLSDAANYFVVKTQPNANVSDIIRTIEAEPGNNAMDKQEFVDNTTSTIREVFQPIILVLVLVGMVVGIMVVGLTIVTSTIEKSREYGVLKAIGINDRQLYQIVLIQALITSSFGFATGVVAATLLASLAAQFVPEFVTDIRAEDMLLVFGATMAMGILAALLPSRRINKIDPAEVFKG